MIGRFISPDPAPIPAGATAALNRYSYVYNNPLRYLDPSGLFVMFVNGVLTDDPEDTTGWAVKRLGCNNTSARFGF